MHPIIADGLCIRPFRVNDTEAFAAAVRESGAGGGARRGAGGGAEPITVRRKRDCGSASVRCG